MSYIIMTDTNSDITYPFVDRYDIKIVYMPYFINGQELFSDLARSTRTQEFYQTMRDGVVPTTSLLTQTQYEEYFEPYLQAGQDILFICFSSNLSASIAHAAAAVGIMNAKYPKNRIILCDTLTISFSEAMIVVEAAKLREAGATIDEAAKFVMDNRMNYQSWVAVEDLVYLKRGGRISAASATFGTMLDIKPIIHISNEGKMVPVMKVKGQKKALRTLLDKFEENCTKKEQVAILDADCKESADYLQDKILEKYPDIEITRIPVGPVICTHAGPGTVALVFPGLPR